MSPVKLSQSLGDDEVAALHAATVKTLEQWRNRLLAEAAGEMPKKVTAFRDDMYVHGRFGKPCRVCGEPVQRIRYKSNETNYCAPCQTGGKVLADRVLSQLMRGDWPSTLEVKTKYPPGLALPISSNRWNPS